MFQPMRFLQCTFTILQLPDLERMSLDYLYCYDALQLPIVVPL